MFVQVALGFEDFHKLGRDDGGEEKGETYRERSAQRKFRSVTGFTAKRAQSSWSGSNKSTDARRKFDVNVL